MLRSSARSAGIGRSIGSRRSAPLVQRSTESTILSTWAATAPARSSRLSTRDSTRVWPSGMPDASDSRIAARNWRSEILPARNRPAPSRSSSTVEAANAISPVEEVDALRHLALGQREHARPALGAHAGDLLRDERPRQVAL